MHSKKKPMPKDSIEALQALEKIVSAEQEMRSGAEVGSATDTASEVLSKAFSDGNDIAKGAITSQLMGSALLHSQAEQFSRKKQVEEQAQKLREARLQGLCDDAARLGRAFATASESELDENARETMLQSLNELQEKMSQTEDLVWVVNGESGEGHAFQKRVDSSALLRCFLSEVAAYNPSVASLLLEERKESLVQVDTELVVDIIRRSASDRAYNMLSQRIVSEDSQERVEELWDICRMSSPSVLDIPEYSYSLLLNRVEAEHTQIIQVEAMLKAVRRKSAARKICELLLQGDRVQAVSVLYDSTLFSESERTSCLRILQQKRWKTASIRFIEAFSFAVESERVAEPYCIFPDDSLSPYDVLLLYDVLGEYSPKIQFENEQVLGMLQRFQSKQTDGEGGLELDQACSLNMPKRSDEVSDITLLRYVVFSVISARNEGNDTFSVLQRLKKEAEHYCGHM